jgi:hypothetical protein
MGFRSVIKSYHVQCRSSIRSWEACYNDDLKGAKSSGIAIDNGIQTRYLYKHSSMMQEILETLIMHTGEQKPPKYPSYNAKRRIKIKTTGRE